MPDHRVLAADAAEEAGASLAWPAPPIPIARSTISSTTSRRSGRCSTRAIRAAVKGRAHYLLGLNDGAAALGHQPLGARRGRLVGERRPGQGRRPAIAPALDGAAARARPYSLSALQRFATCPYQFLLATIHRLEPWDEPEPLVRMDPLTRGSLFHKVQAEFFRALRGARRAAGHAPERCRQAVATLDAVLDRVAAEYAETLAPAIERVWHDEIGELRRDLGIWVQKLADERTGSPSTSSSASG